MNKNTFLGKIGGIRKSLGHISNELDELKNYSLLLEKFEKVDKDNKLTDKQIKKLTLKIISRIEKLKRELEDGLKS